MTERKTTRNLLLRVKWENAPRAHREWAQHHVPSLCHSTGTVREDRPVLGLHRPTQWPLSPCVVAGATEKPNGWLFRKL